MKKFIFYFLFSISIATVLAQKQTFDLTTYSPPKNWIKEVKADSYTNYSITNKRKTYGQIFIMLSTSSKGGINEGSDSEWEELIEKPNDK